MQRHRPPPSALPAETFDMAARLHRGEALFDAIDAE